jgi:hypothetical protein
MNYKINKILTGPAVLAVALMLSGCASTKVSDVHRDVTGKIAKPAQIWVYSFADTSAEVPGESALNNSETAPQTAEEIALGHKLGEQIAVELAGDITKLGMPAVHALPDSRPAINDIIIRGYLLSVDEGSAVKRVSIGFGSGGSSLQVAVEGFQMTANGQRKLGSGTVESGSGKTPGAAVGLAAFIATANPVGLVVSGGTKLYGEASGNSTVEGRAKATASEIAEQLESRFKQQGWID